MSPCLFCSVAPDRILVGTLHAIAFPDSYPVADGHTLVVPRRHVDSLFDLAEAERQAVWSLVAAVRSKLAASFGVTAFNIGVNDGTAAGQTMDHAHVHIIPRRPGDVFDPRGGVRWVIPDKAKYWTD